MKKLMKQLKYNKDCAIWIRDDGVAKWNTRNIKSFNKSYFCIQNSYPM